MALAAFQIPALFLVFLSFIFLLTTTTSSNWRISSIVNATNWKYEGLWMNCEATSLGFIQCNTSYLLLNSDRYSSNCLELYIMSSSVVPDIYLQGQRVLALSTVPLLAWLYTQLLSLLDRLIWWQQDSNTFAAGTFIQICRALMITSLVLGLCGTLLALLSLKCPQLGFSDEKTKGRISMTSGMVFALAGLSSMVALSWYAVNIITEVFDPFYAGTKYEMGYALYLGWTGSLLSIVGGILLTCSSCK